MADEIVCWSDGDDLLSTISDDLLSTMSDNTMPAHQAMTWCHENFFVCVLENLRLKFIAYAWTSFAEILPSYHRDPLAGTIYESPSARFLNCLD